MSDNKVIELLDKRVPSLESKMTSLELIKNTTSRTHTEDFLSSEYINPGLTDAVIGNGYVRGDALASFVEDYSSADHYDETSATVGVVLDTDGQRVGLDDQTLSGVFASKEIVTSGTSYATLDYSVRDTFYMDFSEYSTISTQELTLDHYSAAGIVDRSGQTWYFTYVNGVGVHAKVVDTQGVVTLDTLVMANTGVQNTNYHRINVDVDYNNRLWVVFSCATQAIYYFCLNGDGSVFIDKTVLSSTVAYNNVDVRVDGLNQIWMLCQRVYRVFDSEGNLLKGPTALNYTLYTWRSGYLSYDPVRKKMLVLYTCSNNTALEMFFLEAYDVTTRELSGARVQLIGPTNDNSEVGNHLIYNPVTDTVMVFAPRAASGGTIWMTILDGATWTAKMTAAIVTDNTLAYNTNLHSVVDKVSGDTYVFYGSKLDTSVQTLRKVTVFPDLTWSTPIKVSEGLFEVNNPFAFNGRNGDLNVLYLTRQHGTNLLIDQAKYAAKPTQVKAYLSNNGGATWKTAKPGQLVQFDVTGSQVKVRFELTAPYFGYTPYVMRYSIIEGNNLDVEYTNQFVSRVIPSVSPIYSAAISPDVDLNGGTVDWFLSNDAGANWVSAKPGAEVDFDTYGSGLVAKAEIRKAATEPRSPYIFGYSITSYGALLSPGGDSTFAPGTVVFLAGSTVPNGWLTANGAEVSRQLYLDLFLAIGTTYGAGDGVDTFNLPDLRGEFVRGWDDGKGVDAGRVFGSGQDDEFKSHFHTISYTETTQGTGDLPWNFDSGPGFQAVYTQDTTPAGGSETRPRNVAMLPCIKY